MQSSGKHLLDSSSTTMSVKRLHVGFSCLKHKVTAFLSTTPEEAHEYLDIDGTAILAVRTLETKHMRACALLCLLILSAQPQHMLK